MLSVTDIAEGLAEGLQRGTRYDTPYPLTLFRPFSPQLYAELIANLPADSFYEPFEHPDALRPDGSSSRTILSLAEKSIACLPPPQRDFWSAFARAMCSTDVRDVFMSYWCREITDRFRLPLEKISCSATVRLGRDSDGYRISPHPDGSKRIYTAQVYLARDDTRPDIGTTVYERETDGSYRAIRRLPYLPNTAFCFARTDHSFHGVEQLSFQGDRNNLHISGFRENPAWA